MNRGTLKQFESYLRFRKEYGVFGDETEDLLNLIENHGEDIKAVAESDDKIKDMRKAEKASINLEQDIAIPMISEAWSESRTLAELSESIKDCAKCRALASGRKNLVFGSGNPNADIAVVGEAPGAEEDVQGLPFVGRAGKLLTDILAAIDLSREEVYICNILKCRPPDNRNPLTDEIENCEPYLEKQLQIINPKLILALGTFAAQTLLKTKEPLGRLRGQFHTYRNIRLMVTYHPAALLRNPSWKRPTWEDVKLLRKEYDMILKKQ